MGCRWGGVSVPLQCVQSREHVCDASSHVLADLKVIENIFLFHHQHLAKPGPETAGLLLLLRKTRSELNLGCNHNVPNNQSNIQL